jgi:hypothetical protein
MKSLFKLLIIAVGMLMVAGSIAYAADVTVESGNAITGTKKCELTISGSDLSVSAPTTMGLSTTTFANSPIGMTILDNQLDSVVGTILNVKISAGKPSYYGTSGIYYIKLGAPSFTMANDSEITAGELSTTTGVNLTDADQGALGFNTASGTVLSGSVTFSASLIVNANKRVYGDTSDSITIQYTLIDK